MAEDTKPRRRVWGLVVAMLVAPLVAFVAMAFLVFLAVRPLIAAGHVPLAVGAIVVQSIVVTALIWVFLFYTFIKPRAPQRARLYFGLLFIPVALTTALAYPVSTHELADSARDNAYRAGQSAADLQVALEDANKAMATVFDLEGSAGFELRAGGVNPLAKQFHVAVRDLLVGVSNANRDESGGLEKLDYPSFMVPSYFAKDRGLVQTAAKLAQVRAILLTRERQTDKVTADYRAWLVQSKLDDAMKRSALGALDAAVAKARPHREAMLSARLAIVDHYEAMLGVLRKNGRWTVTNGFLSIPDNAAYTAYRNHLIAIDALAHKLRAVQ